MKTKKFVMLMFCESYSIVILRLVSRSFALLLFRVCVSVCVCALVLFCFVFEIPRWAYLYVLTDIFGFHLDWGGIQMGLLTMAVAAVVDCNWVVSFKLLCRTTMLHIPVNVLGHSISQSSIIGCIIRAGKRE